MQPIKDHFYPTHPFAFCSARIVFTITSVTFLFAFLRSTSLLLRLPLYFRPAELLPILCFFAAGADVFSAFFSWVVFHPCRSPHPDPPYPQLECRRAGSTDTYAIMALLIALSPVSIASLRTVSTWDSSSAYTAYFILRMIAK